MAELEAEKEMRMHETQVESACWENQIWQHNPDGRIVPRRCRSAKDRTVFTWQPSQERTGKMSTRFVSKRQSIVPGSCFSGEWQDISALESGLVKAKLELLPDSSLTERELQQRDYEQGYNATKRHKDQRSRFHMYIKAGFGGSFKGDSKPCKHYLATGQLLLQASVSAPPSIMCGEAFSEA